MSEALSSKLLVLGIIALFSAAGLASKPAADTATQQPASTSVPSAKLESTKKALEPTLQELANEADFVAIVKVIDTDYEFVRSKRFPIKGQALLKTLIPYKGTSLNDVTEVPEKGRRDDACYFPNFTEFGGRYLTFLKKNKDSKYSGKLPYCALPVYVTENNQYALRYPVLGIRGIDPAMIRELNFTDASASMETYPFTREQIRNYIDDWFMREVGEKLIFTRGIYLQDIRPTIFPQGMFEARQ